MAKDLDAKCKKCRRAGERLFLKGERCNTSKCAIVKRNYPPGCHGAKGKKRLTDYGLQLQEKQKARRQYNLMEKQFRLTLERAKAKTGNTGENFLCLLEMRLDNVVFRLGLASSRGQARQMVSHGLLTVNDQRVTVPSYATRTGDIIKIKSNKKDAKIFNNLVEVLKKKEIPGWLNMDTKTLSAKILHKPTMDIIAPTFNIQMIIEYYSR